MNYNYPVNQQVVSLDESLKYLCLSNLSVGSDDFVVERIEHFLVES